MKKFLLVGAAVLGMMTSGVMAQSAKHSSTTDETSTTDQTTTIVPSAPQTTTSSSTTGRGATPDGDQTATAGSSFTDANGVRTDTTITNTTYPLTRMITTTKKTTVTANGVATETVTITNNYPDPNTQPPTTSTSTRTYIVGGK